MERALLAYIGAEHDGDHVVLGNDIHAVETVMNWAQGYENKSANVFLHVYVDRYPYTCEKIIGINTSAIDYLIDHEKEFTKGANVKFDIIFVTDDMERNFGVRITKRITLCGIPKSHIKGIVARQSMRGMSGDGRVCP